MTYRVAVIEEHYIQGELTTRSTLISAEEWATVGMALTQMATYANRYEIKGCKLNRTSVGMRMCTLQFTRDTNHREDTELIAVEIVMSDQTVRVRPQVTDLFSPEEREEYEILTRGESK